MVRLILLPPENSPLPEDLVSDVFCNFSRCLNAGFEVSGLLRQGLSGFSDFVVFGLTIFGPIRQP